MPQRILQIAPYVMTAILAAVGIAGDPPRIERRQFGWHGCGCNLDLKWSMLFHPAGQIRSAVAWLMGVTVGIEIDQWESRPLVCPIGRWPNVVGKCDSTTR